MAAQTTRERILEAAGRLLSERGYEGASVNDIVEAASVNKRMVYHYFGDKRALYREVLASALAALKSHQQAAVAHWLGEHPGYDIRDLIKHSLLSAFDYLSQNPAVARLLAWEGLESGADSRALWPTHQGPLFEQLTAMLVQAQTECHLDARFDPDHLAVCLLGALGHHITHGHTYVGIHRLGATHPDTLSRQRLQLSLMLDALLLE